MRGYYALIVIGAGPAGMAAATVAGDLGVDTLLLDEQPAPGGQIYRQVTAPIRHAQRRLGSDYTAGRRFTDALDRAIASGCVEYHPDTSVWDVQADCTLSVLVDGRCQQVRGERILICSGALERPMPVRGWQLPGVMTVGGAQILLKTTASVPDGGVVIAGSGPLTGLLASQYIAANVDVVAIVDTTPRHNLIEALRYLPAAMLLPEYLIKGVSIWWKIRRAGIRIYRNAADLRVDGDDTLTGLSFRSQGSMRSLGCSHLFLHNGIIPQIQLAQVAGCRCRWNHRQLCWEVDADGWGKTSVDGIHVAGDSAAIGGADLAGTRGRRIGARLASELSGEGPGKVSTRARTRMLKDKVSGLRHQAFRPFLETLFRPSFRSLLADDETLICRCEEVTAGTIRKIARRGCQGPNQAKSFSRAGMGPCQGRQCNATVAALIADTRGERLGDIDCLRARPPVRPVTLGQLGGIPDPGGSAKAAVVEADKSGLPPDQH